MTVANDLHCPQCGHQFPAGAAFCRECGHDLRARAPALETKGCPQCDAQLPAAAQFCASCGHDLSPDESLVPTLELEPTPEPVATPTAEPPPTGRPDRRVVAIAAAVVLLVGGGIAFALTSGGDTKPETQNAARAGTPAEPAAATPEPTIEAPTPEATVEVATPEPIEVPTPEPTVEPALAGQVQQLDALMQLSVQGRAAAVSGEAETALELRRQLLRRLQTLRSEAADPALQAAIDRFTPAIRESLRQNRECGSTCSAAELRYVGRLKREALRELNPLLEEYVGRTYRREEI